MNYDGFSKTISSPSQSRQIARDRAEFDSTTSPEGTAAAPPIDVVESIKKHRILAAGLFLGLVAAGVPYVLISGNPTYEAEAILCVSPEIRSDGRAPSPPTVAINQEIVSLGRYQVLSEVVQRLQRAGVPWRKKNEKFQAAVQRMRMALTIHRIPDSDDIAIGISGSKAEILAPVLNTLLETRLEQVTAEVGHTRSQRLNIVARQAAEVETELEQKAKEQEQHSKSLGVVDIGKVHEAPDDVLLTEAREALDEARRKRVAAEAQLDVMLDKQSGSPTPAMSTAVDEAVSSDSAMRDLVGTLTQRSLDLRAKIEGLLPTHPLRKSADAELASVDEQLKRLPVDFARNVSRQMEYKLRAEVDRTRRIESEIEQEVREREARVESLSENLQESDNVRVEMERLRARLVALKDRAADYSIAETEPAGLEVVSPAEMPLVPTKGQRKKLAMMLLAIALLVSVGTPIGIDLLNQSILDPMDVERVLGFPPVGLILERSRKVKDFREEHFRRLTSGIQRGIMTQAAKCILFTSVRPHGRCSGVIEEIAGGLVTRDIKTLIIDANAFHSAREVNATPGKKGLADILSSSVALSEGVQQSNSQLPARIEVGSTKGLAHLPLIARLHSVIEQFSRQYDVILVEAPPLLVSADAEYLAGVSDITLLVVEAGKAKRSELQKAKRVLQRIGVSGIGAILTDVKIDQAGTALRKDFADYCAARWSGTLQVAAE
jgi:Mrp family chromosome partitioning ATPase